MTESKIRKRIFDINLGPVRNKTRKKSAILLADSKGKYIQYKMKTKVNEIYIYSRGQSAPAREFTRGRDWRERYFSVLFTQTAKESTFQNKSQQNPSWTSKLHPNLV
jgi:hypothetical protein